MTELLDYGIDEPRLFVDDDGNIRGIEDDPEFRDLDFEKAEIDPDERKAALDRRDQERRLQYQRPATLEVNQSRILTRGIGSAAVVNAEPNVTEDLGGGLFTARLESMANERPLDKVILTAKDTEVVELREAVERFGMNELTLEQYQSMSDTQKKYFILPFLKFRELLHSHLKRIRNAEGRIDIDYNLLKYHTKEIPVEDVLKYADLLDSLMSALDETGISAQVDRDFVEKFHINSKVGREAIVRKTDYKKYQLTFKIDKHGGKHPIRDSHRLSQLPSA